MFISVTATMRHDRRAKVSNDLKKRVLTDVVLSACFATIFALCVVMLVGLSIDGRKVRHATVAAPRHGGDGAR